MDTEPFECDHPGNPGKKKGIVAFGHKGDESYHQKGYLKNSGSHRNTPVALSLIKDVKSGHLAHKSISHAALASGMTTALSWAENPYQNFKPPVSGRPFEMADMGFQPSPETGAASDAALSRETAASEPSRNS